MKDNPFKRQRSQRLPRTSIANPYEELYGLRENPFPSMALFMSSVDDPRQNGEIYDEEFRKTEEHDFFEKFVLRRTGDEPLRLGFVRVAPQAGGRGNGKSAFLHHLMTRINDKQWYNWPGDLAAPELNALAVHLLPEPRKQNQFFQLIRLLFSTLHEPQRDGSTLAHGIDFHFRASLLSELLPEEAERLADEDGDLTFLDSSKGFFDFLDTYDVPRERALGQARDLLGAVDPRVSTNDLIQGLVENNASLVDMQKAWVERSPRMLSELQWSRNGSERLVNGLVPILAVAGYRRLYVLLDEFEKIYIYQTSRRREEFLDSLRQVFYERSSFAVSSKFITTILSIHPSIDPFLAEHWERVGLNQIAPLGAAEQRRSSVQLGASNKAQLTHLLITYMDFFRTPGDNHHGSLWPFDGGSLDDAMARARYFPRDTLRLAYSILKEAAESRQPPPIPSSFVESVLDESESLLDEDELVF